LFYEGDERAPLGSTRSAKKSRRFATAWNPGLTPRELTADEGEDLVKILSSAQVSGAEVLLRQVPSARVIGRMVRARAERGEATKWPRIAAVYTALAQIVPSPIVELNRAVAVAMAFGPAAGLELVDALVASGELATYHLLPAVRGDLLAKLGRNDEAARRDPADLRARRLADRDAGRRACARARVRMVGDGPVRPQGQPRDLVIARAGPDALARGLGVHAADGHRQFARACAWLPGAHVAGPRRLPNSAAAISVRRVADLKITRKIAIFLPVESADPRGLY